jgi:hypothetical protein
VNGRFPSENGLFCAQAISASRTATIKQMEKQARRLEEWPFVNPASTILNQVIDQKFLEYSK